MVRESIDPKRRKILELLEELNMLVKELEPRVRVRISSKLSELYSLIMAY